MSDRVTWHILGAGALGSLFAAQLRRQGQPCELLGRRGAKQEERRVDLGEDWLLPVKPLDAMPPGSIGHLLLTTKAWAVAGALSDALPYLQRDAAVVVCANGLGFEEALQGVLPGLQPLRAVTTEAAHRSAGQVIHAGTGSTQLGNPRAVGEPPWFAGSLGRLPGWHWEADIAPALRRKFAINCSINALTAVHDCRNGELVERPELHRELEALCRETEAAMLALGLWPGGEGLLHTAETVCRATAANHSSMLQDRRAGRRTEIAYLNGYLLQRGRNRGLELPATARLCAALGK